MNLLIIKNEVTSYYTGAVKEFIASVVQLNTGKVYEVNIKTAVLQTDWKLI